MTNAEQDPGDYSTPERGIKSPSKPYQPRFTSPSVEFELKTKLTPIHHKDLIDNMEAEHARGHRDGFEGGHRLGYGYGLEVGSEDGFNRGFIEGQNAQIRKTAAEKALLTKGESEKAKILSSLHIVGIPSDVGLLLTRQEPEVDEETGSSFTTDTALFYDGIREEIRMQFDGTTESVVIYSKPIPTEAYPEYSQVADSAIEVYRNMQEAPNLHNKYLTIDERSV